MPSNAEGWEDLVTTPNRIWTIPAGDGQGGGSNTAALRQRAAHDPWKWQRTSPPPATGVGAGMV